MKRFVVALSLFFYCSSAYAAWSPTYDERVLYNVFLTQEGIQKPDVYLEKRVLDLRMKLRKTAESDVQKIIQSFAQPEKENHLLSNTQLLEQAQKVVDVLSERIRAQEVDLDLLKSEQKMYTEKTNGVPEGLKITQSLAELQTRVALLEEQKNAFEDGLILAQKRVNTLEWDVRFEQAEKFIGALNYVFILVVAILLDRWIKRRFVRTIEDNYRRYLLSKLISGSIYLFAIFIVLTKILFDHPNALASLAIVGAGFAIAMQDIIKDVFGWVIIVNRHLYSLGNRVSIGQYTGDVIDIGLLRTTMREVLTQGVANPQERAGKILFMPNALVLREPVLNFNAASDYFGVELSMVLTHSSNWKKAESILMSILDKHVASFAKAARSQQKRRTALFFTFSEVRDPTVDIGIDIKGITLSLKFTVPIGSKQKIFSSIWRDILEQFSKESDLHFAKE